MASDLAPSLLVALDTVVDPNFRRSVVLMLHHDQEEGALGLIVNRTTEFALSELCENLDISWHGAQDSLVAWGGPVQPDEGWVLFGGRDLQGIPLERVTDSLYWSRSQEALRRVAEDPAIRARVFLGYAGWGPGQLEQEIAQGSWLVVPLCEALIFDEEAGLMWDRAVRSLGIDPATLVATTGVN